MCLIKLSRREPLAQLAKQIATRQVECVEQKEIHDGGWGREASEVVA